MTDWLALSDQTTGLAGADAAQALLTHGLFVMEFALPLTAPGVLLDYRAQRGWERHFAVFADPATGVSLVHRQGAALMRHAVSAPLPQDRGTARLTFAWDAPARRWCLGIEVIGLAGSAQVAQGSCPMPLPMDDVHALATGAGVTRQTAEVLWFGFARGLRLPDRFPWIGQRTPLATPSGLVAAGLLRPGDLVLTADHGPLPLAAVRHHVLPTRGSFTPVLLRAPYISPRSDLLVSAEQRILRSGADVEFMLGEEEVLIEAQHLVNGRSALFDTRRPTTTGVELDFGLPVIALSDGCKLGLTSAQDGDAQQPRRVLRDFEAIPLANASSLTTARLA